VLEVSQLPPRRFRKVLRFLRKGGDVFVRLAMTLELSLPVELLVLRFGDAPGLGRLHRAAGTEDRSAQLVQLPVQKRLRVLHHHEPAQVELILEDVEQDGGEAIEFPDLAFGQVVLRDGNVGLADVVVLQLRRPMFSA